MRIAAKTDIGKVRKQNQDSYAAGELPGGVAWAVVCDGMGGASGGNVASAVAVKMISERIASAYQPGMGTHSIKNMLLSVIERANISLFDMAQANDSLSGMGTTVVVAIVEGETAYLAHAGDSRAYRANADGLFQLTRDHSIVQEMVENGEITPDQAKAHPRKNIITRALGVEDSIAIDFREEVLSPQDVLILCTDGLTNYVETDDIYAVTQAHSAAEYAERLVALANLGGGGDNVTVVTLAY